MNATFCIAAARCGWDDGHFELIGSSLIIDPEGHIMAESQTLDDELVVAEIDLDACLYAYAALHADAPFDSNLAFYPLRRPGKERTFCFAKHRRPEHYTAIATQKGVMEPAEDVSVV